MDPALTARMRSISSDAHAPRSFPQGRIDLAAPRKTDLRVISTEVTSDALRSAQVMRRALLDKATSKTALLGDTRSAQISSDQLRQAKVWAKVRSSKRGRGDLGLRVPCRSFVFIAAKEEDGVVASEPEAVAERDV